MSKVDKDRIWKRVDHARSALATRLDTFTAAEWDTPSLCEGWRAREVIAHLTSIHRVGLGKFLWGMASHGFNPDRFMKLEAQRHGTSPTDQLLREFRALIGSRKKPPPLPPHILLLDQLIHTQDILFPLGESAPIEPEDFAQVMELLLRAKSFGKLATAFTLRATDADWSAGSGPLVRGSCAALLLVASKRPAGLAELSGEGASELGARLFGAQPRAPGLAEA